MEGRLLLVKYFTPFSIIIQVWEGIIRLENKYLRKVCKILFSFQCKMSKNLALDDAHVCSKKLLPVFPPFRAIWGEKNIELPTENVHFHIFSLILLEEYNLPILHNKDLTF